jgi:exosortase/archaeosortase
MRAERATFDTIEVQGHLIQFVVACTLIELMLGIQPLLWRRDRSLLRNFIRIALSIGALFGCNIVRIEVAQILFSLGIPWMLSHDIPLGAIYFGIWVIVWQTREWQAFQRPPGKFVQA